MAAQINWERIEWLDKEVSIVGQGEDESRAVVADLVGLTQDVEGSPLRVLLHPEIQMGVQADTGWRVLQYNAGLTLQQADPNARVLTIVFYHCRGGRGARGARRQRHRLEFRGELVLEVGYWSVGIGDLDAEEYANSDNPMAWALAAWMRQPKTGRAALRLRLRANILRSASGAQYRRLLLNALRTYFTLAPGELAEEQRLLDSEPYREVRKMNDTWLDGIEESARREGEHKGEQRGVQRGLQHALMAVLLSRFPAAPEAIRDEVLRVQDPEELNRLIRRAATASSLDDVWPPRGH